MTLPQAEQKTWPEFPHTILLHTSALPMAIRSAFEAEIQLLSQKSPKAIHRKKNSLLPGCKASLLQTIELFASGMYIIIFGKNSLHPGCKEFLLHHPVAIHINRRKANY
jgi:hypothetical protein